MTQTMTFLIPPYGTATLVLPEMLTLDTFCRLEKACGVVIGDPCLDLQERSAANAGAAEFDSWVVQSR